VRHFYQIAQREHGVQGSYSFVKKALQVAGLVSKRRPRGRHRRRREPRPCFGELLHLERTDHMSNPSGQITCQQQWTYRIARYSVRLRRRELAPGEKQWLSQPPTWHHA